MKLKYFLLLVTFSTSFALELTLKPFPLTGKVEVFGYKLEAKAVLTTLDKSFDKFFSTGPDKREEFVFNKPRYSTIKTTDCLGRQHQVLAIFFCC